MLSTVGRFLSRVFLICLQLWHTHVNPAYRETWSTNPSVWLIVPRKTQVTQVYQQPSDSNEALWYSVGKTHGAISKITLTKWILYAHKQERIYSVEIDDTVRPFWQIR